MADHKKETQEEARRLEVFNQVRAEMRREKIDSFNQAFNILKESNKKLFEGLDSSQQRMILEKGERAQEEERIGSDQARAIITRAIMDRQTKKEGENLTFVEAFNVLQVERPGLFLGYKVVLSRKAPRNPGETELLDLEIQKYASENKISYADSFNAVVLQGK